MRLDVKPHSARLRRIRRYRPRVAVDEYNRRAIEALTQAQQLSGARSGNAFARMLSDRAHGSPSASTYRRWIAGEAVVPAWAIQVAADVAGTTVQALLDGDGAVPAVDEDWRARIEDALGRLEGEMIEVRQRVGLPWQSEEEDAGADDSDTLGQRSAN
jgi:hypothetical protein